ncbi:Glucuronoyl esterase catalytic domain from Hypocrea Jecorina [Mycena vitilis]|nr:Glucuronoyl esterase catalytic domain from Hypocrea Jecorina [Mycena vitilis]
MSTTMFASAYTLFVVAACTIVPVVRAQCPTIPSLTSYSNTALPDPFTFAGGSKVVTTADWACRSAEVSSLLQTDELGTMPGTPQSVTASFSGNTLTINVTDGGKSISFAPTITFPTSGTAPFPAIIGIGGISIPAPAGVAIINFNNDDMGLQNDASSRGQGKFFQLYGSNASAGAMMAWAWGVRRIMDAIEKTPAARIDPTRVGVSGCSRNGKGALVAGAFEPRIVLTIPQESGSGGTDSWRLSDSVLKNGTSTQTASEIIQENVWFSTNFNQFATSSVNKLPFDHHLLMGMVAPRALFVIDNVGYDWLGPYASYGALVSARTIWTALGAPTAMGYSQAANHVHCSFPSSQQTQLNAFVNKYLLGQSTNTNITETAGSGYQFAIPNAQWAPWTPPAALTPSNGTSTSTVGSTTASSTTVSSTSTIASTIPTTPVSTPTGGTAAHWGQCLSVEKQFLLY